MALGLAWYISHKMRIFLHFNFRGVCRRSDNIAVVAEWVNIRSKISVIRALTCFMLFKFSVKSYFLLKKTTVLVFLHCKLHNLICFEVNEREQKSWPPLKCSLLYLRNYAKALNNRVEATRTSRSSLCTIEQHREQTFHVRQIAKRLSLRMTYFLLCHRYLKKN